MTAHSLVEVFAGLGRPRVMVLGDLLLDRYTWGDAERISQEAPVIVLRRPAREPRWRCRQRRLHARRPRARVTCVGITGADAAGEELRQLLTAAGIDHELVLSDPARPTSVKERFIGRACGRHPSQILRVDHESTAELDARLEDELIDRLVAEIPRHEALLISDYGKGVCTPRLLLAVISAARRAGVPVIVDPSRSLPLTHYRGATMIKPNRVESELATGRKIASTADALEVGRQLCHDLAAEMALITLDRDGMLLVKRDGSGQTFPTQARAVYDITGAGDMVLAMVGLCLAAGADSADAVRLANVAAGLEVQRSGVAVIYRDEIMAELASASGKLTHKVVSLRQAALLAAEHRRRGERVVFTNGCFDLLHVGHVQYLSEAAALGDALFVGVNSDQSVRRLKGPSRPVIGEQDRAALLGALACVRQVVVFEEDTPHALIEAIRPDVLVKGGTYTREEVVGHEIVESYGGMVCVTNLVGGVSTTNILAGMARGETVRSVEAQQVVAPSVSLRRAS